ncbi:alpha/beta fold hydrolase [Aestuariivita sp.]|jgi:pimeloyl-ACP methyl ester carboxylesterase|uniref:alpha/beta hydrolase n=1 Tax=Aestuariivita sp. TaxID=1872407 RepID=UPI00216E3D96|nr:alpha/beta fold hydrolase [Aestuariivita sp.]MCE8007224.1 alpha/beta hydrolase [Aestuariivita sp.]
MRVAPLFFLFAPMMALAETVEIDGPAGPLAAEGIAVEEASHAVVIIPGSGPTDRDGNAPQGGMQSDSYKMLAEGLARAGIASLRIDKRGFFASQTAIADPNDVTIGDYAQDARDWIARAADLAPCVWLAGHSEGGLVALVAAQSPPEALCGLILMATPGRPIGQLMLEQMRAMPGNAPLMPELEATVAELEAGRTRDPVMLPGVLQPMFSLGVQRYMIDLFSYDPAVIAEGWTGPTLIVQGDADIQIKPLDADLLTHALPQAERVDLPGATHMLKTDVPGQPFVTYTDPTLPLHGDLIPAISGFVDRHGRQ